MNKNSILVYRRKRSTLMVSVICSSIVFSIIVAIVVMTMLAMADFHPIKRDLTSLEAFSEKLGSKNPCQGMGMGEIVEISASQRFKYFK